MTTNFLAKDMAKYYSRKGNRIIFTNGFTLNKLSLDMWEKLGYKEIDASALSRVVSGKRLLTFGQLDQFCRALSLSKNDRESLIESLSHDLADRYGLQKFYSNNKNNYEDLLDDNVIKIRQARLGDAPILASGWADNLKELLRNEIGKEKDSSRLRRLILMMAQLLKEDGHIKLGISLSKDVEGKVMTIAHELQKMGKGLMDPEIVGVGYGFAGAVYYVLRDYQKAIINLEKGKNMLKDPEELCFTLRLLLLSYAYLNDDSGFMRIKAKLRELEAQLSSNEKCELYEGFSRGSALMGKKKDAENYLQRSLDILKEIFDTSTNYKIARKLQLARSEIEIGSLVGDKYLINRSESLGKESIQVSKMFGYDSYGEKIEKVIGKMVG